MNIFAFTNQVGVSDFGPKYEVAPADLYPNMAAHITEVLESGANMPGNLSRYLAQAKALGAEAFDLVGLAKGETLEADLPARAEALEVCRLWFTELLHAAVGYEKIHLHITFDEAYKL